MDLCNFINNIVELCCSLFASILFYWSMILDLLSSRSLPMEKAVIVVGLDFLTSVCWILYALHHHPVSWFLMGGNFPPLFFQLLCFILVIYYQFRGSQIHCLALRTRIALGTELLIFVVVSLLWIFDVVSRTCFPIFAILTRISSCILTVVRLWQDLTPGNWKIIAQSFLRLVNGAIGLLMGIQQHNILFVINSVVIFIFELIQLGFAFFPHIWCTMVFSWNTPTPF